MTDLAERFEELRPRLLRVAYSQLGSLAEAEDVVQEAWLRLERADADAIEDLGAWLTTVVGRLGLDALASARVRRERYVGPWLPDPLVDQPALEADPADRLTLHESVSLALLFVLERLSPPSARRSCCTTCSATPSTRSRRSSAAPPRPRASSPRERAATSPSSARADRERTRSSAGSSRRSWRPRAAGDVDALLELLDPDVVMRSDGSGKVTAARTPLVGADRVSRAVIALARNNITEPGLVRPVQVNGLPGLLLVGDDGAVDSVVSFSVDAGQIVSIHIQRNPDKLRHVQRAS